jgi:hypothetical protein
MTTTSRMHRIGVPALSAVIITGVLGCRQEQGGYTGPYADEVRSAIPAIEKGTGLKFKTQPKVERRSAAQVREFVVKQFNDSRAATDIAGLEGAYKVLGLLPDTMQLKALLLRLLEEQIVGYYDPATKVLYIVDKAPKAEVATTVTHELVHALQDQYISLDSIQKSEANNDQQTAAQAVIEGQAMFEQLAILSGSRGAVIGEGMWDRVRTAIRQNQSGMPIFASAPTILQESLLFPYLSGAEFVRAFSQKRPGQIPFNAMPKSTEQILHSYMYFEKQDTPSVVTLPALRGGTAMYQNTLGEFETRVFFFEHLGDRDLAVNAAAGWDGDRYAVLNTAAGRGFVWVTVWDTPVDAGQFYQAMDVTITKRFTVTVKPGTSSSSKQYSSKTREIRLETVEIGGRPAVVYIEMPAGQSTAVIDVGKVTVK